jgi:amidophosphoribosyltransferase
MAREAGARKVYLASAAPPVRHPNVYGIDMPTRTELIAHGRDMDAIRAYIGCDALIYQDVDAMKRAVASLNPALAGFEASCFDGHYVTGDVTDDDFREMQQQRSLQLEEDEDTPRGRLALQSREEGA